MSANPFDDPELWHYVTIAGRETPGTAVVSVLTRKRKYDEKEGPGRSGETLTFRGNRGVSFTVKLRMTEPEEYDAFDELHAYLAPIADRGDAVDFWYPSAELIGVRSVLIESISAPVNVKEGDALFEATLELREYRPAPKTNATKTASGSKTGNAGKGGDAQQTALTEREREAQRLIEEARRIG